MSYLPGVYTIDIQQGNIIEQSMIDQLRPGMNQRQVLYIMGSPMLNNVFHKNRWDYVYSNQPSGEDRVQKQISLFFENDQIAGIQGDFRPSATPVIKTSGETTVDVPKRDLEKTLWEKITGLVGYDELDAPPKADTKKTSENNLPL
jgi:outer membrane protein assembly factor BamE